MDLTPEQQALLPSDADVHFYQEHGWWISPVLLDAHELEDANFGAERYYAGERDAPLLVDLHTDWKPEDGEVLRQNDYVSRQVDEFRDLLHHPLVAATAARLSGADSLRLFHDQLIYKPPGAPPERNTVGWHADKAYWQTCTSTRMLTAWIPLQESTEELGTLVVLDKSHHWSAELGLRTFHNPDLAALEARIRASGHPMERVPLVMEPGQVSFHHCLTIHGSYPNVSDRPRLAYAIHLQDGGNVYQAALQDNGKPVIHINDILCGKDAAGQPDYADPAICPEVWPL